MRDAAQASRERPPVSAAQAARERPPASSRGPSAAGALLAAPADAGLAAPGSLAPGSLKSAGDENRGYVLAS